MLLLTQLTALLQSLLELANVLNLVIRILQLLGVIPPSQEAA